MSFDQFAKDYKELVDQSIAGSGESVEYFAEYKARYIARLLHHDFHGKVLDFGCGIGMLSSFVQRYLPGSELHGYDISRDSVRLVNKVLFAQGLFTSDITKLDHDYRLVVLANVMHHVPVNHRRALIREAVDHLAIGGRLVIFEHNPANPFTRRVVDRCPFDKDAILLWPEEARRHVAEAELRVTRCDYIVFLPRSLSLLRFLEPSLSWLPLGAQYALVGEKDA